MFDYKQRPFARKITDAEYDQAVGRKPSPTIQAAIQILSQPRKLKLTGPVSLLNEDALNDMA